MTGLLLGLVGNSMQIHAAQEPQGPEIKQKVAKLAVKLAPQAEVIYHGSPKFLLIDGTSIAYATNSPDKVIHIGNAFYFLFTYYYPLVHNTRDVWLVSASAQGPWVPAHFLPELLPHIVCSQVNAYPVDPYQLCALPWTSGLIYAGWNPA
jgi:hypothetical protein